MGKYIGETKSGSVNGITFSHNRYGQYMRRHAIPVNPNTAAQRSVRNAFGQASAVWRSLTETQKQGWKDGAMQFPSVNNIGDQIILDGHAFFVKVNTRRINAGMSALTDWDPSAYVPSLFELTGYEQKVVLFDDTQLGKMSLQTASAITPDGANWKDFYGYIVWGCSNEDAPSNSGMTANLPVVLKVSSGRSYAGGFVADSEMRVLARNELSGSQTTGSFSVFYNDLTKDPEKLSSYNGTYFVLPLQATQNWFAEESGTPAHFYSGISGLTGNLYYRFQLWTDNANKLTQDLIADFWMFVPAL